MKYFILLFLSVFLLSCTGDSLTSIRKVEFEGHDYLAYKCGYGVGFCHSASCKLCSHGDKNL